MTGRPRDADAAAHDLSAWTKSEQASGGGVYLNANAVVAGSAAALILGAPGAGKSTLSLVLMTLGARLLADDGVWLHADGTTLMLRRPSTAPNALEHRGIGLLPVSDPVPSAVCTLALDLDRPPPHRLPRAEYVALGAARVRLICLKDHPNPAPAILHILRHGMPLTV